MGKIAMALTKGKKAIPPAAGDFLKIEPFYTQLSRFGLKLTRGQTTTLQINVGLLCNQACKHCHLEAGPNRKEVMSLETMDEVISFARRGHFQVIDITGGAPELNPNLPFLIQRIAPLVPRLMIRFNLTSLCDSNYDSLIELCRENRVAILASVPSLDIDQMESQRGKGTFKKSIFALKKLNALGYGQEGPGLELDLVSNPIDSSLPGSQGEVEKEFKTGLKEMWGITFSQLYLFNNVPLGRFRRWLNQSGSEENYLRMLVENFNPQSVEGLMCRALVSVSWDGYLYDCDFNLARSIFLGGRMIHVSEMDGPPAEGSPIAVSDHCYACTAKAGFT